MATDNLVKIPVNFIAGMNDTIDPVSAKIEFNQIVKNVFLANNGHVINPFPMQEKTLPELNCVHENEIYPLIITDLFPVEINKEKYLLMLTRDSYLPADDFNHKFYCMPIIRLRNRHFGNIYGISLEKTILKFNRPRYTIWKDYLIFAGLQSSAGQTICLRPSKEDHSIWFDNTVPWGISIVNHQNTIIVGGTAGNNSQLKWGRLGRLEFDAEDNTNLGVEKGDGITNTISVSGGLIVLKEKSIHYIEMFPVSARNKISDIGCPTGEYDEKNGLVMFVGHDNHIYSLDLNSKEIVPISKNRLNNFFKSVSCESKLYTQAGLRLADQVLFNDPNLDWHLLTRYPNLDWHLLTRSLPPAIPQWADIQATATGFQALRIGTEYVGSTVLGTSTIPFMTEETSGIKMTIKMNELQNNSENQLQFHMSGIGFKAYAIANMVANLKIYVNNVVKYSSPITIPQSPGADIGTITLPLLTFNFPDIVVYKNDVIIAEIQLTGMSGNEYVRIWWVKAQDTDIPTGQIFNNGTWQYSASKYFMIFTGLAYNDEGYVKNRTQYGLGSNEYYCGLRFSGALEDLTSFLVNFDLDWATIEKSIDAIEMGLLTTIDVLANRFGKNMNFKITLKPYQIERIYIPGSNVAVNEEGNPKTWNTLTPHLGAFGGGINYIQLLKTALCYNEYPSRQSPRIVAGSKGFYTLVNRINRDYSTSVQLVNFSGLGGYRDISKIPESDRKNGVGGLGIMEDTIFVGAAGKFYIMEEDYDRVDIGSEGITAVSAHSQSALIRTRKHIRLLDGKNDPFIPRELEVQYVLKNANGWIKFKLYDSFVNSLLLDFELNYDNIFPYAVSQNIIKNIPVKSAYAMDLANLPKGFYLDIEGENFEIVDLGLWIQPVSRRVDTNEQVKGA
jgi:hypothetical protein